MRHGLSLSFSQLDFSCVIDFYAFPFRHPRDCLFIYMQSVLNTFFSLPLAALDFCNLFVT